MELTYKQRFIRFMVENGVLTFGEFTLKSGRKAPYFINTGNYKTGAHRKEVKDHGEGGMFVGKQLKDGEKVILIEDVMTSGKALREMLPKLAAAANVQVAGMVISVDRQEKALGSELSAVQEAYKEFGVKVYSIVTMQDIIDAIEGGIIEGKQYLEKMKEYRSVYGA